MYTTTTRDKLCKLNRPTLVLHETLGQIQVFVNKPRERHCAFNICISFTIFPYE